MWYFYFQVEGSTFWLKTLGRPFIGNGLGNFPNVRNGFVSMADGRPGGVPRNFCTSILKNQIVVIVCYRKVNEN